MSILILPASPFTLRSSWVSEGAVSFPARYFTPSAARRDVVFAVSSLPRGCEVESAVLTVRCALPDGGTFLIAGSPLLTQDLTARLSRRPSGGFADLTIPFFFQGVSAQERCGFYEAAASVTSAVLTVLYSMPSPAPETGPDPGLFFAPSRDVKPEARLQFPDGSVQQIGPGSILSFRLDQGTDDGLRPGTTCAAALSVRLSNAAGEWFPGGALRQDRPLLGSWLRLSLRAGEDIVPLGSFHIEEMAGADADLFLELRGYDAMACLLEGPYAPPDSLSVPLSGLLSHLAAQCGLTVSGSLPVNGDISCQTTPAALPDCTVREALGFICEAGGAFAYITPEGILRIEPAFPHGEANPVPAGQILSLSHDERVFSFRHLRVIPFETAGLDLALTYSSDDSAVTGLNTVLVRNNPLFPRSVTQTFELSQGLFQALSAARWQALDMAWRGDPSLLPGTPLSVAPARGAQFSTVLAGQTLLWDRGFSARAFCPVREDDPVC